LVPDTLHFVGHQIGLGLSLFALLDSARNVAKTAEAVGDGYRNYFFDENGFSTLEGGKIAPPTFDLGADTNNPTLGQIASEVRKFASRKTADQYIRDLIRVTVESSCDEFFHLTSRYGQLRTRTDERPKSPSLVQGICFAGRIHRDLGGRAGRTRCIQLFDQPLIAASLATFAGTAARNTTQNVFLLEIGLP